MKKIICILMISLSFIFLFSCSKNNNNNNNGSQNNGGNGNGNATAYTIKDYYPFEENVRYDYTGSGNEYATFKVWVDYINNDRIQLRKNNGGTETVTVLENKNGELKSVFSRGETYYRENFTSKTEENGEVLLKEPLVKGTSWTLADGRKRYISAVDVTVGSYKAIEVTTENNKDSSKNIDYYGLNAGLVKTVFKSGDSEVTSTLTNEQKDVSFEQNVRFYYPNGNDGKIYYTDKKLSFKTNDITRTVFETNFKQSPNNNLGKLIGPDVKIKSLYLNNNVVYVDFSKELVPQMNAGSGYEASILQSITNTLGGYYNVTEVYITIEDEPYSSGHIAMNKGETFKVNTSNCVELK
ncbi:MAG: GerMN domain-containing protein [Clostridiaceae bacterium]